MQHEADRENQKSSGPVFSRDAFKAYFRSPSFLVVEQALAEQVSRVLPDGIGMIVIRPDQQLYLPEELDEKEDVPAVLSANFNPVGCLALVVTEETKASADHLITLYDASRADITPPIVLVQDDLTTALVDLIPTLFRRLQHATIRLGNRDQQIAHLRRKTEALLYDFNLAQQKLDGVGVDRDFLLIATKAGARGAGPGGDLDTSALCQQLPCDLAFLTRLDMEISTDSDAEGCLEIQVTRDADGLVILHETRSYDSLTVGSFSLPFNDHTAQETGEATLTICWLGDSTRGPLLALSDGHFEKVTQTAETDQHNVPPGFDTILAMSLYRGLRAASQIVSTESVYANPLGERGVSVTKNAPQAAPTQRTIEAAERDMGGQILSVDPAAHYVQTHPVPGYVVGFRMSDALTYQDQRVEISVETEHQQGPETHYHLLLVKPGAALDDAGGLCDPSDLLGAQQVTLPPLEKAKLVIDLSAPLSGPADLIGLVSLAGTVKSFGWCRWRDLRVARPLQPLTELAPVPNTALVRGDRIQIRSFRFPDFQQQARYLRGRQALLDETEQHGFSPLMIMDDGSYMQTHPLVETISGAFLPRGIPADAENIYSDVRTAHHGTEKQLYFMAAATPPLGQDATIDDGFWLPGEEAACKAAMMDHAFEDGPLSLSLGERQVRIAASPVAALERQRLALDTADLGEADVVWGVIPLTQSIAFGWCRWYGFHIETRSKATAP